MSERHRVQYTKSGLLLLPGHDFLFSLHLLHPTKTLLTVPIYYPPDLIQ